MYNSILPTTVFIDPQDHAVYLLGGWWYSTKAGDNVIALPAELMKILPSEVLEDKIAKTTYDRQAVKGVAIGCLGDSTLVGSKLLVNKSIPNAIVNWVRLPSVSSAVDEYQGWYEVLKTCFGKRKFIELNVNIDDVY